jgi:hypothetical protein
MAHHDGHVGAQLIPHHVEHPPCIFQFLGQAEAKFVVGRDERRIERRRVAANGAPLLVVLLGAKLSLDGIAKGLRTPQMGRSTKILLSTHAISLTTAGKRQRDSRIK